MFLLSAFSEAVSLARLVEAEIVFPLFRDSHQYGRGKPNRARSHAPSIEGGFQTVTETALGSLLLYNETQARSFSSILYLYSLGVRPMVIVRLSGHPLIQDSLSSP